VTVKSIARLGDIAEFKAGNTLPGGRDFTGQDGGFLLLKVGDMNLPGNERRIAASRLWTASAGPVASTCEPGCIVIPKRGGAISTNKKRTLQRPAILDPNLMGIQANPRFVDSRYLFQWFQALDLEQLISGSAVPQLNKKDLDPLEVPLPPLPEQHRIADILDNADAIRRKRKEVIALTEELLRSAFLKMFGDPVMNPKGWPVRPLQEVIAEFEAGWSANGEARQHEAGEYGVLKVSSVTSGVFRPEEHKAVAAAQVDRTLVTPKRGDLLFSRANTRELVAATCLVESDHPSLFLPDKLWRLCPHASVACTAFLRFLLAHQGIRGELTKTATGTSGSMLNVSMEKLRALRAPVPPLPEQKRFERMVWASLAMKKRQTAALESSEQLFAALVDRCFRGGLRFDSKNGQLSLFGT
jgi:type I restriction enzyme S subunit